MIRVPRWKPCYEAIVLGEDVSAVVSEASEHLLHGSVYPRILPLVDGRRSFDEIVEEAAGGQLPESVAYHLLLLEREGFIEESRDGDPAAAAFWAALGVAADAADPLPVVLVAVGGAPLDAVGERLARSGVACLVDADGAGEQALRVVVTRDYLEPGLADFNREAFRLKMPWLLFKPFGAQPWVGPLFVPGEGACWTCLAWRLRGHRTVETFAEEIGKTPAPLRLSRGAVAASLGMATDLLALELGKLHRGAGRPVLRDGVLSLDLKALELRHHRLRPVPHCPECGPRRGMSKQARPSDAPLRLCSRAKSAQRDGGHRIRLAEQTLAALEPEISPVCGVIGRLKPFHPEVALFGSLYQASFAARRTLGCFRDTRLPRRGVANGKGRTDAQAKVSAIAEAMERYCAIWRGDEPTVRASFAEVRDRAVPPNDLFCFSPAQWRQRVERCRDEGLVDPYAESVEIDWTPAYSLTEERWRLLPASHVYVSYPCEPGRDYARTGSNGLAAGNCLEEAILQGIFEVVERDALSIWWYSRARVPALDWASFGDPVVAAGARFLTGQGWGFHVLDLTTDLGVPTFVAAAIHGSDPAVEPVLGSGTHFDPSIALTRAVGEVAQGWKSEPNMFRADEFFLASGGRHFSQAAFLQPHPDPRPRSAESYQDCSGDDILGDVLSCVALLQSHGMETMVADLTRADVPLKAVRICVAGARPVLPAFASGRLYDVPVALGWVYRRLAEEELNPVPFYQTIKRA